jgi:ubiquinone/menaquinone biosynthesis C-methylase UbiE
LTFTLNVWKIMINKKLLQSYNAEPHKYCNNIKNNIADFTEKNNTENINHEVVKSFGDEWTKFNKFSDKTLEKICGEYFDIIDETIVNKSTYMIDIGCGTGRWSEYFLEKTGFIEAVDPSDAILVADKLLGSADNVRLTKASVDTLPWPDNTFDFAMSVGVLHHIPDTKKALINCVKKVKKGGYFYVYLYYKLDNRSSFFKFFFGIADIIRRIVSRFPPSLKKLFCDILAVIAYLPFVLLAKVFFALGFKKFATKIPLSAYANKDFYIIRNDCLDRFGTKLEHRFTKAEVEEMMREAGLDNIKFGDKSFFWHAVGKKV